MEPSIRARVRISFNRLTNFIFERYCSLMLNHPRKVIFFTLILSTYLTCYSIYERYQILDFDPIKGFDTRGTHMSDARLVIDVIQRNSASPTDILRSQLRKRNVQNKYKETTWREFKVKNVLRTTTMEPISIDYDDYGVNSDPMASDISDPCVQYMSMGRKIPYEYIDYLAKIIVQLESVESMYSLEVFRQLCAVDDVIRTVINTTNYQAATTQFKHSFNLPYYSTCLNLTTPNNCASLNENDISFFQTIIEKCQAGSKDVACENEMIEQVLHYLTPNQPEKAPAVIAIILPITLSGNGKGSQTFYSAVLTSLERHFTGKVELKGTYFNTKNEEFKLALRKDAIIACGSAVLVLLCFFFYSRSVFFTTIILAIIFLSMGISFFFYAVVLRIDFFPFINLLVIVLMIAIGADDAFLLLVYFKRERMVKINSWRIGDPYNPLYRESDRVAHALRCSLSHSLVSMFVTSITTAVAFLSNLSSEIIVLRCFGIFASITVVINYVLVILLLPSTIILTCASNSDNTMFSYELSKFVTQWVYRLRFAMVLGGLFLTVAATFIIFFSPGLSMPHYNPTKLLVNTQPHEWFDNNAHFFNFEWKRKIKIMENYMIGINTIREEKSWSLRFYGEEQIAQNIFRPTIVDLMHIQAAVNNMMEEKEKFNYSSWINQFLASNVTCLQEKFIGSSCFLRFCHNILPSTFPEDLAVIPSDGPIFNKQLDLLGYFIAIPSNTTLVLDSTAIEKAFETVKSSCKTIKMETGLPTLCLSSSEVTKYYDIITHLYKSTFYSILISIVVSLTVVVLYTRQFFLSVISVVVISAVILWTTASLILVGWELSVIESTILVLTIGLSFDYTLHYAVAFRGTLSLPMQDRIKLSSSSAGKACLLGTMSSMTCGLPLIFANTAAFQEVGTMLIALNAISLLGASILFPALLSIVNYPRKNKVHVHRF